MIYLTGCTNNKIEPALIDIGVGIMAQPDSGYANRLGRYPFFGADNGCFADRWQEDKHLRWLDRLPRDGCLFAVAPDVYPDAAESLRRGLSYADLLRGMGFPVAVVAQDGAERLSWPWEEIDVLFVGGERRRPSHLEWKVSAAAERVVKDARNHGKWVHMGRANSLKRMERARQMGCNSADGTFLRFPDTNLPILARWLVWLDANPMLPVFTVPEGFAHDTHRALVGVSG